MGLVSERILSGCDDDDDGGGGVDGVACFVVAVAVLAAVAVELAAVVLVAAVVAAIVATVLTVDFVNSPLPPSLDLEACSLRSATLRAWYDFRRSSRFISFVSFVFCKTPIWSCVVPIRSVFVVLARAICKDDFYHKQARLLGCPLLSIGVWLYPSIHCIHFTWKWSTHVSSAKGSFCAVATLCQTRRLCPI